MKIIFYIIWFFDEALKLFYYPVYSDFSLPLTNSLDIFLLTQFW